MSSRERHSSLFCVSVCDEEKKVCDIGAKISKKTTVFRSEPPKSVFFETAGSCSRRQPRLHEVRTPDELVSFGCAKEFHFIHETVCVRGSYAI